MRDSFTKWQSLRISLECTQDECNCLVWCESLILLQAKTIDQAAIHIWDVKSWKSIAEVKSHRLTVVQMEFSPNSELLLSVSRDLGLSVLSAGGSDATSKDSWKVVAKVAKAHSRIIWCCAWANDSAHFATGSRDGSVRYPLIHFIIHKFTHDYS